MPVRIASFERVGLVVKGRRQRFMVAYGEILTAERRAAPRRGIRLHVRAGKPVDVRCGRRRLEIEGSLRWYGVRVVDCWGCMITPTLLDFEDALQLEPPGMRQSYDDA